MMLLSRKSFQNEFSSLSNYRTVTKTGLRSKGKKKTCLFTCAHKYIDVFMRKKVDVPQWDGPYCLSLSFDELL